jgi:2-polyprenyl-3-methyl-5-hydroxy-6-metoxy-1,4-benzoquinol methylase
LISFKRLEEFPGWISSKNHKSYFESLFREYAPKTVLEIGSGANPTLAPEFVNENGISYVTNDVDARELEKADRSFQRLVLDLSVQVTNQELMGKFDCVMSRMVGEHVGDGEQYHRNIYNILKPGGISAHCFSTLWNLPLAANRVLPESVSAFLLQLYSPHDKYKSGKFKAYYSWSRGPSQKMIKRFEGLGFEVLSYTGYFGHNYYLTIPFLHRLEMRKAEVLLKYPIPMFCAYSTLILRKPA